MLMPSADLGVMYREWPRGSHSDAEAVSGSARRRNLPYQGQCDSSKLGGWRKGQRVRV